MLFEAGPHGAPGALDIGAELLHVGGAGGPDFRASFRPIRRIRRRCRALSHGDSGEQGQKERSAAYFVTHFFRVSVLDFLFVRDR
jgi:hypothetical protein